MHDSTHTSQVHADGRVALWLTGLAFTAIHVAFSGRYGFHRDELLSYSNAINPAIGDRNEVYVCRNIRVPWPEFWKGFQYYG